MFSTEMETQVNNQEFSGKPAGYKMIIKEE